MDIHGSRRAGAHRCLRTKLGLRANLTAYDPVYVALAERLDAVLLTGDGPLSRAPGPRCTFEVLSNCEGCRQPQPSTAPTEADCTSLVYLASTPRR